MFPHHDKLVMGEDIINHLLPIGYLDNSPVAAIGSRVLNITLEPTLDGADPVMRGVHLGQGHLTDGEPGVKHV